MDFEPFRAISPVNTGVPCPKVPIHRKLGYSFLRKWAIGVLLERLEEEQE
jgi:hypothetical protein